MPTIAGYITSRKIFENNSTAIFCGHHPTSGRSVLLKLLKGEHPNNERLHRFRREYALLSAFDDDAIIKTYGLEKHLNSLVIILEDCLDQFELLSDIQSTTTFSLDEFLHLAVEITKGLGLIHDSKIVCRRLTPASILVSRDRRRVKLIDFSVAIEEKARNSERREPSLPDSALPYISPEQTGRIEHPVDHRSDLYSLGITLFQLATGALPFRAHNPGELIHAHLAKKPPPPESINRALTGTLSAILLKLLEKSPSRRYQACVGVLHDFNRCKLELAELGRISTFSPGQYDLACTLELPDQLSSRARELRQLQLRLAAAAQGRLEVVMITGPEGVGKSSLAKAFAAELAVDGSYFVSTCCHSVSAGPFGTMTSALRQLIAIILSEDGHRLAEWRRLILTALGNESGALTSAFPETEQLIGPQDPPQPLPPAENEYRLFRVVGKLLRVVCENGPLVVLFLDSLHDADPKSLDLIHHLLSSARICRLLFLGSFRNDVMSDDSPLTSFRSALALTYPGVHEINLENLHLPDIASLLAGTLGRPRRELGELAALCLQKTGGNPYYLRQFLHALHREGHLRYSQEEQRWEWRADAIRKAHITDNTAAMVKRRIPEMEPATIEFLRTAACLGESCTIMLVAAVLGYQPDPEIDQAQRAGMIFTAVSPGEKSGDERIVFAHKQIRDTLLLPLGRNEISAVRLRAGRHLLYTLEPDAYGRRLQEIADYLSGDHVWKIASRAERLEIAKVHLDAGRQNSLREQFHHAHRFFITGIRALPDKAWQTDYQLCLDIHLEACATTQRLGDHARLESYFHKICAEVEDLVDISRAYRLWIQALKARGEPERAVQAGLEILARLGIVIPTEPTRLECMVSLLTTRARLLRYDPERLLNLPAMTDRNILAIMDLLRETATTIYVAAPRLLPFVCEHGIRLSLRFGNCVNSALVGYLTYGFLLCAISSRTIHKGCGYGALALQLLERLDSGTSTSAGSHQAFAYYSFISHWQEHVRETLPPLKQSLQGYYGRGNLDSTANTAQAICLRQYLVGTNLSRLASEIDEHHELIRTINQNLALNRLGILGQAVDNLLGTTGDQLTLKGRYFNEETSLSASLVAGDLTTYCTAMIIKLVHAVLFHHYEQAIGFADKARKYLNSLTASVLIPVYYFYDSLARIAVYEGQGRAEKILTRLTVSANQRKMRRWARLSPKNYAHKYILVEAECKRVLSHRERAMELYDNAIHLAHEHEYIHEEALAYELASRFYSSQKNPHIARLYLREARYCYYRWGATAKLNQLDSHETSPYTEDHGAMVPWTVPLPPSGPGEGASRLDMLTVIKASRILTSEMVLDELLKKMMKIMLESGGAQKGALIFKVDGDWQIRVWGSATRKTIITLTCAPINSQNIASTAIINYVAHSAREVVLNDACREGDFTGDLYVQEKKPRSILCLPILHLGEIFCILYLENTLSAGTFPPDRQELLHLLGVQAAISLKNALLFEKLDRTVGQLNEEVEIRRDTQRQLLHAEKLSALGRLSASIAHEFGNPLMGLKYLLDDFHRRHELSAGDRQLLALGLEECERMKNLIRDLQRLNKPSSGEKSKVDIHQLIDNVLLFQKKQFSANHIALRTDYDHNVPKIEIIADQISQVLFNLTLNAGDAMAEGGGTLTVTTRQQDGQLLITISDTGHGIPHEHQDQIFEPFFSTKKEEDGTGLGLSISYGIARHHGGDLHFSSIPEQGAAFTLVLPLQHEETLEEIKN